MGIYIYIYIYMGWDPKNMFNATVRSQVLTPRDVFCFYVCTFRNVINSLANIR